MLPHEKTLVKRLENQPFALIGVNTDKDQDEYKKQAELQGVTWRSSWQGSTGGPWCKDWGVTSFPTIYVLDAKGVIRFKDLRDDELEKAAAKLIAELEKGDAR